MGHGPSSEIAGSGCSDAMLYVAGERLACTSPVWSQLCEGAKFSNTGWDLSLALSWLAIHAADSAAAPHCCCVQPHAYSEAIGSQGSVRDTVAETCTHSACTQTAGSENGTDARPQHSQNHGWVAARCGGVVHGLRSTKVHSCMFVSAADLKSPDNVVSGRLPS